MAKFNIKFNNKNYSIDKSLLADATARLEAHLMSMMGESGEETLEGDGQEFYTLAPTALTFRSTEPLNEFQEVRVNGQVVDPSNYTLEEGSTIVKLSIDYLKTLPVGGYNIEVASANNAPSGGFTVAAPELNEHGFYYNQPYSAWVDYFGDNTAFFVRENGTIDLMFLNSSAIEVCSYTIEDGVIVVSGSGGTFTGTLSETEIYCNELAVSFILNQHKVAADKEFIYVYEEHFGGYKMAPINQSKSSYGNALTNINDIPVVRVDTNAFSENTMLSSITLPINIRIISGHAFSNCINLTNIYFNGSISQWNAITKSESWNLNVPATHVHCLDGDVAL